MWLSDAEIISLRWGSLEYQCYPLPQKPRTEDDRGVGDSNRLAAAQLSNESADSLKSPKRLSKSEHNILSEIFRKIGSKENTKEVSRGASEPSMKLFQIL